MTFPKLIIVSYYTQSQHMSLSHLLCLQGCTASLTHTQSYKVVCTVIDQLFLPNIHTCTRLYNNTIYAKQQTNRLNAVYNHPVIVRWANWRLFTPLVKSTIHFAVLGQYAVWWLAPYPLPRGSVPRGDYEMDELPRPWTSGAGPANSFQLKILKVIPPSIITSSFITINAWPMNENQSNLEIFIVFIYHCT